MRRRALGSGVRSGGWPSRIQARTSASDRLYIIQTPPFQPGTSPPLAPGFLLPATPPGPWQPKQPIRSATPRPRSTGLASALACQCDRRRSHPKTAACAAARAASAQTPQRRPAIRLPLLVGATPRGCPVYVAALLGRGHRVEKQELRPAALGPGALDRDLLAGEGLQLVVGGLHVLLRGHPDHLVGPVLQDGEGNAGVGAAGGALGVPLALGAVLDVAGGVDDLAGHRGGRAGLLLLLGGGDQRGDRGESGESQGEGENGTHLHAKVLQAVGSDHHSLFNRVRRGGGGYTARRAGSARAARTAGRELLT